MVTMNGLLQVAWLLCVLSLALAIGALVAHIDGRKVVRDVEDEAERRAWKSTREFERF